MSVYVGNQLLQWYRIHVYIIRSRLGSGFAQSWICPRKQVSLVSAECEIRLQFHKVVRIKKYAQLCHDSDDHNICRDQDSNLGCRGHNAKY